MPQIEKIIRRCRPEDRDPSRPASEQRWCLFDAAGLRLLGRFATIEEARAAERRAERFRKDLLVPVVAPARGFYSLGADEGLRYQGQNLVIDGKIWSPAKGPWCAFLAGAVQARGSYGQAVAIARSVTKRFGRPVGIGYIRGWDTGVLGPRYLVQLHGVCRMVNQQALLKAAGAVEKAVLNPLTVKGFDRIVSILTARLRADIGKVTKADVTAMLNAMDVNWNTGTVRKIAEAEKVIKARMASAGKKAGAQAPKTLKPRGDQTVRVTRRETIKKWDLGIEVGTQVKDLDAIRKVAQAQSNFVTDFYTKQLDPALSKTARSVVQQGIAQGLPNRQITADLRKAMAGQLAGRTAGYYKVVSSQFVNRARSWSQLNAFSDAGIDRYIISAVLDERTTDTCRALDGKTLDTKTGLAQQEAVNDLGDPTDVKVEQPWFIEQKIGSGPDEGKNGLYLPNKGGGKSLAGVIEKSGFGRQDDRGKTSWKMSDGALQARGVGSPPYHGHCRTTIVPDI